MLPPEAASSAPQRAPAKNPPFTQVYPRGWDTLAGIADNPAALKVYAFLAKNCDHMNALVCPVEVLVEELGLSDKTVRRATKWLSDNNHVTIIKVGTANAYVLDPRAIWKNFDDHKRYCRFGATTLASKAQNKDLKSRLTLMFGEPDETR